MVFEECCSFYVGTTVFDADWEGEYSCIRVLPDKFLFEINIKSIDLKKISQARNDYMNIKVMCTQPL